MVFFGISSDALKRVDAAEADVKLMVAELLNRLREPIGELPRSIEGETASRIDRTDHGDRARQQRQRRAPDVLPRVGAPLRVQALGAGEPVRRQLQHEVRDRQKAQQSGDAGNQPAPIPLLRRKQAFDPPHREVRLRGRGEGCMPDPES